MFYHHASEWVIKGDHCLVSSSRQEAAHGQITLFFLSPHARARAVLSTRAKVLSQSKVSKFIPHARIYVTHLCPRGALACFQTPAWCRLDPGPRCSLPCPCLSALGTNKRDGTNGTERLVQEADVRRRHPLPLLLPPRPSPFLLTPSDTYNHSPRFDERPAPPSS